MKLRHIFTILGLSIGCALSAQAQQLTLKVAHFLPAAAPAQKRVMEPWCEQLKQESKGQIACQFYPAMQLGGTPANLVDQVRNGVADVVWTSPGYSAGRFQAIEAFELPFMVIDSTKSSEALWKYYEQYAAEEFKQYKVLAFHTDGGQAVHTSSKAVTSLEDFKNLKLRSSTRVGAKTLGALGGIAVSMPPAQVTEAVSKGVVDGALGAWELVFPTKLSEVTKYHTQPESGVAYPSATVLVLLMNKEKYEGLSPELKAILDKNSGEALVQKFSAVFDDEANGARKRITDMGGTITNFTAQEVAKMKAQTAAVDAEWAKQVSGKGLDGSALVKAARQLTGTQQ